MSRWYDQRRIEKRIMRRLERERHLQQADRFKRFVSIAQKTTVVDALAAREQPPGIRKAAP